MNPKAVAIVGGKKVGKTTTTEALVKELTNRGYRVAAIKHVSEEDFTIDTPGKDTWRFAQAGAKKIVVLSTNEVATIEKGITKKLTLSDLLKKCEGSDIVLIEGFKRAVSKVGHVPKIVVITSQEEALKALERYEPILMFSGSYNPQNLKNIPYYNALVHPEKLTDKIEAELLKK